MDAGVAHGSWATPASSVFLSLKAAPVCLRGLFFWKLLVTTAHIRLDQPRETVKPRPQGRRAIDDAARGTNA